MMSYANNSNRKVRPTDKQSCNYFCYSPKHRLIVPHFTPPPRALEKVFCKNQSSIELITAECLHTLIVSGPRGAGEEERPKWQTKGQDFSHNITTRILLTEFRSNISVQNSEYRKQTHFRTAIPIFATVEEWRNEMPIRGRADEAIRLCKGHRLIKCIIKIGWRGN